MRLLGRNRNRHAPRNDVVQSLTMQSPCEVVGRPKLAHHRIADRQATETARSAATRRRLSAIPLLGRRFHGVFKPCPLGRVRLDLLSLVARLKASNAEMLWACL